MSGAAATAAGTPEAASVHSALAAQPALAPGLVTPQPDPVLAPLVAPPLTPDQATGLDLILEGFLLHHGRPRHLDIADAGTRVLAGDYCYAQGLVRVAEAGDLEVIEVLADLVALSSALVAAGRRDRLPALWRTTAAAIAGGGRGGFGLRFRAARRALRDGDGALLDALAAGCAPTPALDRALAA